MDLRVLLPTIVLLCVSIGAQVSAEETTTSSSVTTAKQQGGFLLNAISSIRRAIHTIIQRLLALPLSILKIVVKNIPFLPKGIFPGDTGHTSTTVVAQPAAAALTTAAHSDATAATTTAAHGDATAATTTASHGAATAASTTASHAGAATAATISTTAKP